MAERGNEKYRDVPDDMIYRNDEASEDGIIEDGQSDPDQEEDGEDLDENLDE